MTYEVQVTIPYFNALPRDCCTNVLHFDRIGTPPGDPALQALVDTIVLFYEGCYNDTNTCAAYAENGATQFKIYNLADAQPRPVRFESVEVMGLNSGSTVVLPPEASVVLSLHATPVGGIPAASTRGRVYLGVLGDGVASAGTAASFPTISEAFRTDVISAGESLVGNAITAGWTWVVYSRTQLMAFPVIGGHVDDAFDTQRRRGQDPTIRNTWP